METDGESLRMSSFNVILKNCATQIYAELEAMVLRSENEIKCLKLRVNIKKYCKNLKRKITKERKISWVRILV